MEKKINNLSSLELYTTILIYMMVALVYGTFPQMTGGSDSWIITIVTICIGFVYVFLYLTLTSNFPNKTIFEINILVYGKYLGKMISILYLFVFLSLCFDTLLWFSYYVEGAVLPDSPRLLIIVLISLLSFYTIKGGIISLCRYSVILAFFTFLELIAISILLFEDYDFSNLLPIATNTSLKDIINTAILYSDYSYGETLHIFFMFFPMISNISDIAYKKKKNIYKILILGGIFMLIVSIINTAVIGNLSFMIRRPTLYAISLTNIRTQFSMEVIFIIQFIAIEFFIITAIYNSIIRMTSQLLNIKNYRLSIVPIGIIILSVYYFVFQENISEVVYDDYYNSYWYIYFNVPIKLGLPFLTLIVIKMKKMLRTEKGR
ncbi:MAG: spore germination protein [Clostridia bacterium]|nr:spore germination protein [Clostridia bacterium]